MISLVGLSDISLALRLISDPCIPPSHLVSSMRPTVSAVTQFTESTKQTNYVAMPGIGTVYG